MEVTSGSSQSAGAGWVGRPAAAGPTDWVDWIRATLTRQAALRNRPDWTGPEETLDQLTKKVTGELNYLTEALLLQSGKVDIQDVQDLQPWNSASVLATAEGGPQAYQSYQTPGHLTAAGSPRRAALENDTFAAAPAFVITPIAAFPVRQPGERIQLNAGPAFHKA